jgi:formylglycine-generating enzyme required for sulfatase activity
MQFFMHEGEPCKRYTVTVAQYAMFAKTIGHPTCPVQLAELANNPDFPVVNVTWYDAQAFCRWVDVALAQKRGVIWRLAGAPAYRSGMGEGTA